MSDDSSNRGLSKFNAWWLAAAILILGVIAALVLILIFGQQTTPNGSPTGSPSTPSAQPSASGEEEPPATDGACDLPTGSDIPTTGPDAEWVNHSGFLAPYSGEFAAPSEAGALWDCYAQSPTGALFGAANFMAGLQDSTDEDAFRSFIEAAAVDNNGRSTFITDNSEIAGPREPGRTAQISGFRFDSVEADEVVVRVGLSQSAGSETVTAYVSITMVWDMSASNWLVDVERVNLRPTVDNLAGYTNWSSTQ